MRHASPRCEDTSTVFSLWRFIHLRRILRLAALTIPPSCGDDPLLLLLSLAIALSALKFTATWHVRSIPRVRKLPAWESIWHCSTLHRDTCRSHDTESAGAPHVYTVFVHNLLFTTLLPSFSDTLCVTFPSGNSDY